MYYTNPTNNGDVNYNIYINVLSTPPPSDVIPFYS